MNRTQGENYTIVDGKRKFTDGPPGTCVEEDFLNGVQEELMGVIEGAGLSPSLVDLTQLYQAIITLGQYAPYYPILSDWEEQSNPKNIWLYDVCWKGDLFVAVGEADGVDAYILTSSDGKVWTEQSPTVAKNIPLFSVCWNGSLFVAVGSADGVDAYIVTSPDGTTWTERLNPKNERLRKVIWCDGLSLFVAVGLDDGGDAYMVTSPDGTNWTERANGATNLVALSYNGRIVVAVGEDGEIVWSVDGITWVLVEAPTTEDLYAITWGRSLFVATGKNTILTSPDGLVWTARFSPRYGYAGYGIVWGAFSFVIVGQVNTTEAFILTSPDGIKWTEQGLTKEKRLRGVCWNGNRFVTVGEADGTDAYIVLGESITTI